MREAMQGPSTRGTRTPGQVRRRTIRTLVGTIVAVIAAACEGSVEPEPPRAASIAVSPASANLASLGDTAVFVAVVRDQHGAEFSASPSWSSSDPTVFTISVAGVATAVGNGTGVVTASFLDLSATATVEVAQLAASVEVVSGGDQSARQGRALGDSIVVRVVDAGGAGVSGVHVSFAPAEGDGSAAPDSTTSDSAGLAATAWTLGDHPGEQRLAVAVAASGGPSVEVSATALTPEETVASLAVASGDEQRGRHGRALGDSIVVRATDREGEAVEGAVIVFAPADGDGTVAPDSVTSNSAGLAATAWTLGEEPGDQRLAASVATAGGPTVDVSATALTPEETVASLAVASGNEQRVRRGRALGDSIVVRATDAEGEAVEGAVIVFVPAEGNGTVAPDSVTSDSAGMAATVWTLGDHPGEQRLTATVAAGATDGPAVEATATALTPEETVTALEIVSGDEQEAVQGRTLDDSIVVRATDAEGEAVEGAAIVFAPANGDGVAQPDSAVTDSAGTARTAWTLGDRPGDQSLAAAVAIADGPSAQVAATATRRRPNHSPEVAEFLPTHLLHAGQRLGLSGSDHFHDPDGDVLSYSATTTNPAVAYISGLPYDDLTLTAASPGISQLVVSATDPSGAVAYLRFSVMVVPTTRHADFEIDVISLYPSSGRENQTLARAVSRWEQIVTADVSNLAFSGQEYNCFGVQFRVYAEVDDLVVFAILREIDGGGGTLGRAGPCVVRESGLPLFATLELDLSDLSRLNDPDLFNLSLHEVGHTLGIGTLWRYLGLLGDPSLPDNYGADTHFTGPKATAAFDEAARFSYRGTKVPVENLAVPGSSDTHWRRSIFGHELMNPTYDPGESPLSAVTIQSLADMGYQVDAAQADPYSLPGYGLRGRLGKPSAGAISFGADTYDGPVAVIDSDGRVIRVLRR